MSQPTVAVTQPTVPQTALTSQVITCTVDVSALMDSCLSSSASAARVKGYGFPGQVRSQRADTVLGAPYVSLTSNNLNYDGSSIFSTDVTVTNRWPLPLGTTDGSTVDSGGVKVFFQAGPTVTNGTGTVTVANADGTAIFTGVNQPYFKYSQIVGFDSTSAAKTWRFAVPSTVDEFTFAVYVDAVTPAGFVFTQVREGDDHACALTTGGAAYCWGANGYGEIGDGTTFGANAVPVAVSGGLAFTVVSSGATSTCGLTTIGGTYCWGYNAYGELGNATTTNSSTPVAVSGGLTLASVSAGADVTCGVTTSGAAFCWGDNGDGELGDSATTSSSTPVGVRGAQAFASVSSGFTTCAVTTAGAGYCWGLNDQGQLGEGTTSGPNLCGDFPGTPCGLTPGAVSGGLTFTSISVGGEFACGVTAAGAAYCWGNNSDGELGDGTTTSSSTPVTVSGGLTFASVNAGEGWACGVTTAGAGYCWGYNFYGELGDGTTTNSSTPVAVSGGLTFASVSPGYDATCGVTTGGAAYCWGYNSQGQLGNGTIGLSTTTPLAVAGQSGT